MRRVSLAVALCLGALASAAEPVSRPVFSYSWSVTGERYSLATAPLQTNVFGVRNLNFNAAFGVESRNNAPVFGAGLAYRLSDGPIAVDAGAYVLNRTNPANDFVFGLLIGVRL